MGVIDEHKSPPLTPWQPDNATAKEISLDVSSTSTTTEMIQVVEEEKQ